MEPNQARKMSNERMKKSATLRGLTKAKSSIVQIKSPKAAVSGGASGQGKWGQVGGQVGGASGRGKWAGQVGGASGWVRGRGKWAGASGRGQGQVGGQVGAYGRASGQREWMGQVDRASGQDEWAGQVGGEGGASGDKWSIQVTGATWSLLIPSADKLLRGSLSRMLPSGGAESSPPAGALSSLLWEFIRCGSDHQRDFCSPWLAGIVAALVPPGNNASVAESDSGVLARCSSGVGFWEQWLEWRSTVPADDAQPEDVLDGSSLETRRPTSWWRRFVSPLPFSCFDSSLFTQQGLGL